MRYLPNLRARIFEELQSLRDDLVRSAERLERKKKNYWFQWTGKKLRKAASPLGKLINYRADDATTITRITSVVQALSAVSLQVRNHDQELSLLADAFLLRCVALLPEGTSIQLELGFEIEQ